MDQPSDLPTMSGHPLRTPLLHEARYEQGGSDAACKLAKALKPWSGQHPLVLAIPRGAVPMARTIAVALDGESVARTEAAAAAAVRKQDHAGGCRGQDQFSVEGTTMQVRYL